MIFSSVITGTMSSAKTEKENFSPRRRGDRGEGFLPRMDTNKHEYQICHAEHSEASHFNAREILRLRLKMTAIYSSPFVFIRGLKLRVLRASAVECFN